MKTERITVRVSAEFKTFLTSEATSEGVSISELIRQRCKQQQCPDERLLSALAHELRQATKRADAALDAGLSAVQAGRAAIRRLREGVAAH